MKPSIIWCRHKSYAGGAWCMLAHDETRPYTQHLMSLKRKQGYEVKSFRKAINPNVKESLQTSMKANVI